MNLVLEPTSSRRDTFAIAGERRNLLFLFIERDFWVCWSLKRLFALPGFGEHLLFKGGTSLSKVYGLIQRFSEDIGLSLSRTALGDGLADPEQAVSNTQRKQRSEALLTAFRATLTVRLLPGLRVGIAEHLEEQGWTLTQDGANPGTLHFAYPRAVDEELSYVCPEVRIELGCRNDDWPSEHRTVTAYVVEELPQITPAAVSVRVPTARRTFWEKATILHAGYHRPPEKASGERLSRRHSDLTQIAGTDIEAQALGDLPLLARVRAHKAAFYTAPGLAMKRPGQGCCTWPPARSVWPGCAPITGV